MTVPRLLRDPRSRHSAAAAARIGMLFPSKAVTPCRSRRANTAADTLRRRIQVVP